MQRFSRELRLLTPEHFKYVFQSPIRASTPEMAVISRVNTFGHPRLGLTIAKKNVKRAHDRNRIKRICRESFRLRQQVLPGHDFIVIAKKGIGQLDNPTLFAVLEKLWQRHLRLAQKSLSS